METRCTYNPESGWYTVYLKIGAAKVHRSFKANHEPKNGYMHISDTEKAVKTANQLHRAIRKQ